MAFTHLHVHTEYSLLDGSSKIKELVARTDKNAFVIVSDAREVLGEGFIEY